MSIVLSPPVRRFLRNALDAFDAAFCVVMVFIEFLICLLILFFEIVRAAVKVCLTAALMIVVVFPFSFPVPAACVAGFAAAAWFLI